MTGQHPDFSPWLFNILDRIRNYSYLIFPSFYLWSLLPFFNYKLRNAKRSLFESLSTIESKDPETRKAGAIRLVEVGIGGGANFEYYPPGARLIAVDRNTSFKKHLVENMKKHGIVAEKLVYAGAEDMSEIPDNSVDVVITSIMICSVDDPQKTLAEIKRILAKGGKYYFIEHGVYKGNEWTNLFQLALRPVIFVGGAGCVWDRQMEGLLKGTGFTNLNITYEPMKILGITLPAFAFYYGTASK